MASIDDRKDSRVVSSRIYLTVASLVAASLLASCGDSDQDALANSPTTTSTVATKEFPGGLEAFSFDHGSIADVTGLIAIGTITGETEHSDGSESGVGEGEPYTSLRELTLAIDTVVAGQASEGDQIVLADQIGWAYAPDGVRMELVEGGARMRLDDRVLVVLVPEPDIATESAESLSGDAKRYRLLTQSAYLLIADDSQVVDTERDDRYVQLLESMTEDEAIAELRSACRDRCDRETYPRRNEAGELE